MQEAALRKEAQEREGVQGLEGGAEEEGKGHGEHGPELLEVRRKGSEAQLQRLVREEKAANQSQEAGKLRQQAHEAEC